MKRTALVSIALAALLVTAIAAQAQPARITQQGCMVATDMALVARALAQQGVARSTAERVMAAIYLSEAEPTVAELRRRVTDRAYARQGTPQELAQDIFARCMGSGGDIDATFGREI